MSSLLYVLARFAAKARTLVIVVWVAVLAILGFGAISLNAGMDNSVSIPGTESGTALERLNATFPQVSGTSAQLIITGPAGSNILDGPATSAINSATSSMANVKDVEVVTTLDDSLMPAAISDDKTTALITIQISGNQTDISQETKDGLTNAALVLSEELPDGYEAHLGGSLFANDFPGITITEVLGVLVALIVMFFTLGTLIAAGLPLLTAFVGVAASMMLILIATSFATINSTTPLLAIMLGLAVGIDYALFIVSRHRDQLQKGMGVTESIAQSMGTAGSAVVFAGMTVMIALVGLSVAGIPFLTTMGIAGAMAVGLAVLVALTFLPAILSFAGMHMLTKKERVALAKNNQGLNQDHPKVKENRFFLGWIRTATKMPIVTIVVVIAALGALAIPALQLRLALPDAGALPKDNDARITYDLTAEKFGDGFNGPLIVTTPIVTSTDPLKLMDDLADEIRSVPGIADIPLSTPNETADTGIIQVVPTGSPDSEETEKLVHDIRALHDQLQDEYDVDISVTGMTAVGVDVSAKLANALLPFALVVVGLSLVLLTIVFRSIAVPVTAAAGYLLSVVAAFGVVTLVFEHGFLSDAFGVTRLGPILNFMPIVVMGILFGLSMDYEVFLVSRMREDYVHSGRARKSVITGFMGSAKVVTAAAIIMVSVFAAFVPEGDMNIKPIALGLAVGVAVDAFLVRMTLIPAIMMWLGDKAWWMPKWLDRVLPTFDIEGEGIVRQRKLKDWPGHTSVIAANNLQIGRSGEPTISSNVNVIIGSEGSLIVEGDSAHIIQDAMLTFSGRMQPLRGDLKILDKLLPERGGAVRRSVAFVSVSENEDLSSQIKRAIDEKAKVISAYIGAEINDLSIFKTVPLTTTLLVGTIKPISVPSFHGPWNKIRVEEILVGAHDAQTLIENNNTAQESQLVNEVKA